MTPPFLLKRLVIHLKFRITNHLLVCVWNHTKYFDVCPGFFNFHNLVIYYRDLLSAPFFVFILLWGRLSPKQPFPTAPYFVSLCDLFPNFICAAISKISLLQWKMFLNWEILSHHQMLTITICGKRLYTKKKMPESVPWSISFQELLVVHLPWTSTLEGQSAWNYNL